MKRTWNRSLSWLLAIIMALGLLPVTAFAGPEDPPVVEDDWGNVYLKISAYRTDTGGHFESLSVWISTFEKFIATLQHTDPIYDTETKKWTMEVTIEGYSAAGTEETHVINYFLRTKNKEGWGLAPGEPTTKTIKLFYDEQRQRWYDEQGEIAEIIFYISPNGTGGDSDPAITDFEKDLVSSEPDGVDLDLPDGVTITYPGSDDKVTIPADGSVTLLYKLTVTGKAGTSFTITDDGATLVGSSNCNITSSGSASPFAGTIIGTGDNVVATLYVTKTFAADDIDNGKVTNTATIASDAGVADDKNEATETTDAEKDTTTPTPTKPSAPGDDDLNTILGNNVVTVECTNSDVSHADKTYGLIKDGYTLPLAVTGDADTGWRCVITLVPGAYVAQYNTDIAPGHTLDPSTQTGSITLTWDEDNGWTKPTTGLPVTFEVKCETYTLTYDANGGTVGGQDTFTVSGISATENYELGKEPSYTAPTRAGMVFMGWTTDESAKNEVYAAGEKIPDLVTTVKIPDTTTVYAVWGEDENGDGTADALQIVITPADITIYAG